MVSAYYNEWESFPAAWLGNLMAAGKITHGRVDTQSIKEVSCADLLGYERVHLFAGLGGWEEALRLAGWPVDAPVWTGSCPCQPFSTAGKGKGTADERHLWPEMLRLVTECHPPVIFGEQVASAAGRAWLSAVRADLEALGYAVGAADLCAAGVGAPHIRQRLYWVAYDDGAGSLFGQRNGEPQEPEQQASLRHDAERCGAVRGGLAFADQGQRGRFTDRQGCFHDGAQAGREQSHGETESSSPSGGLDDATSARYERAQRGAEGQARDEARVRLPDAGRANCGVADADGSRCGPGRPGETGDGRDEARQQSSGLRADGFWSDATYLPCSDGKTRPTQPGLFPLAHGVPGRVGKLRAAGNAIVPQVAATFVRAFMDAVGVRK